MGLMHDRWTAFCLDLVRLHIIRSMTLHILHYARLPWPTIWTEVFGRDAPLLLEIGFGGGHFLVDLAQRRPQSNVVGLEISLPSLRRGAKKVLTSGVDNTRIIQGDSRGALWLLFKPQSISEVTINFPDPWPKASHHHRRLIKEEFLHLLGARMQMGGLLEIATDHAEYATEISKCLTRSPYFDSRLDNPFIIEDNERRRTKYEEIALTAGRTCYYFKWQRNKVTALDEFPIPEETVVPHIVLSLPLTLDEVGRRFEPRTVMAGKTHIKFLDLFHSVQNQLLLVEVYVSEEPFHQRVCLAIRTRQKGDAVVSLHEVGFPRPTPGMHLAVHYLVEWLRSLQDDVRIIGSTLNTGSSAQNR